MPNRYWYYSFVVIGLFILGYAMYRKRNVGELFTFFLASVTFCFFGELIVLFMFKGYMYKPEVFDDPFKNNVIGHVIPNASLWGTLAVLVASLKFRYRGIGAITVMFILLEMLFLKLGLYEHRWWKLYLTGFASVAYMVTVRTAYSLLERNRDSILRFMMFGLAGIVVLHTPSIALLLLDMQFFHAGWVENPYRESILFGVTYHTIMSVVVVSSAYLLETVRYRVLVPCTIVFMADSILHKLNMMQLKRGLPFLSVLAASAMSICLILFLEEKTWKKAP